MSSAREYLKSRIESLKDSDYTAEFSEHEYPPIDLERGAEGNKRHEEIDPKYRAWAEKAREAVRNLGRISFLFL